MYPHGNLNHEDRNQHETIRKRKSLTISNEKKSFIYVTNIIVNSET